MTLEETLSNVNYNIEKIVYELRTRISNIPETTEIVDKNNIIYQYSGEDFCIIKVKKDFLEIDFKSDNRLEDPISFSWKIRQNKNNMFDRRLHIKNMFDIDVTFGLIEQSFTSVLHKPSVKPTKNKKR